VASKLSWISISGCYSFGLAILPGLFEILSHSELIQDAAQTLTRKRCKFCLQ